MPNPTVKVIVSLRYFLFGITAAGDLNLGPDIGAQTTSSQLVIGWRRIYQT